MIQVQVGLGHLEVFLVDLFSEFLQMDLISPAQLLQVLHLCRLLLETVLFTGESVLCLFLSLFPILDQGLDLYDILLGFPDGRSVFLQQFQPLRDLSPQISLLFFQGVKVSLGPFSLLSPSGNLHFNPCYLFFDQILLPLGFLQPEFCLFDSLSLSLQLILEIPKVLLGLSTLPLHFLNLRA